MNRNITPIFLLVATLGTAQPVIQNGDNLPAPGFTAERREGSTQQMTEGPAGADQTWDFSSMYLVYNAQPYIVLEPSASPFASTWPGANYVASYSDAGSDHYFYYNVLSDRLEAVADDVTNTGDSNVHTANPRTKLKFPFAYGETVVDTYSQGSNTYTNTITYDGYGTLITPTNTFENVVRIKWQQGWTGGGGNFHYDWWSLDPLMPVFQYATGYAMQWAPIGVGIEERAGTGTVGVQPNPFTEYTTVTIDATTLANSPRLTLINAMGQVVRTLPLTSTRTQLERGTLANGLYVYHVRTAGGAVATGRFIVN